MPSAQTAPALAHVNTYSSPSELKITDMRFAHVETASMHCILLKLYTNQGLVGMGELRDGSSTTYAAMLKSRILGENPCDVDRLFRRIRQFGGPSRQGAGVSGIEIALWDLAGKAYGIPVYRMLGGKFRDRVPMYCDLGKTPPAHRANGTLKGKALKERMDRFGFTQGKITLSMEDLQYHFPDEAILSGPSRYLEQIKRETDYFPVIDPDSGMMATLDKPVMHLAEDYRAIAHPFNLMRVTEHGLDRYEEHIAQVRAVLGDHMPLAIDHLGHLGLEDAIRLLRRLEKYNLMWCEDVLPWNMHEEYRVLRQATSTPLACGEDVFGMEAFEQLCAPGGIGVAHPDICSCGGILEAKKISDMAQRYNIAMAMHMCESPVAALATGHVALGSENFVAMEFNAPDDPLWQDIVTGIDAPLIQEGSLCLPERPGLGADDFNDEVLRQIQWPGSAKIWSATDEWDAEYSYDRLWS